MHLFLLATLSLVVQRICGINGKKIKQLKNAMYKIIRNVFKKQGAARNLRSLFERLQEDMRSGKGGHIEGDWTDEDLRYVFMEVICLRNEGKKKVRCFTLAYLLKLTLC